jgi:hypothetical protein
MICNKKTGKVCRAVQVRPTQRAPDGWWAVRFELIQARSFIRFDSWFSQPPVTQAVGQLTLKGVYEQSLH